MPLSSLYFLHYSLDKYEVSSETFKMFWWWFKRHSSMQEIKLPIHGDEYINFIKLFCAFSWYIASVCLLPNNSWNTNCSFIQFGHFLCLLKLDWKLFINFFSWWYSEVHSQYSSKHLRDLHHFTIAFVTISKCSPVVFQLIAELQYPLTDMYSYLRLKWWFFQTYTSQVWS